MDFSGKPGPALCARRLLAPGERLLWATYRSVLYFDVAGLDQLGAPQRNVLTRGVGAIGRGVGDFVLTGVGELLLGGGDDSGNDRPPEPDHLVLGPRPGCLAEQAVPRIGAQPGRKAERLWLLTTHRLAVFGPPPPPPEPAPEPQPEPKSFFDRAKGVGKGLVDFGREVATIVADTRRSYGPNTEGEPVPTPEFTPRVDFPRPQIAAVHPVERGRRTCLRVSFVDGSGFDFHLPEAELAGRIIELTNGAR